MLAIRKEKNKLGPLKAGIEATDRLIDQIVYKLYGLREEDANSLEGGKEGLLPRI
jgi:hypothetical protein